MKIAPLARSLVAFAVLSLAAGAHAQGVPQTDYPNKPVKLIVSFPPGGFADLAGRSLAQLLQARWHQPVIVDNRPGAAGIIASEAAAKAAPDGYTLYLATDGPFSINQFMYKTLPYDPVKDFIPVAMVAYTPLALVVNPELVSADSVKTFVAAAKKAAATRELDYASAGAGGPHQLAMESFKMVAGINLHEVPYKGGAPALQGVLGGQVAAMFSALATSIPQAGSGRLKIIATGGPKRSALAPEVPTIAESGYPGFTAGAWAGVVAPAGTPEPVLRKIEADVVQIVAQPRFAEMLTSAGAEPYPGGRSDFTAMLKADQEKNGRLIRALNLKVD